MLFVVAARAPDDCRGVDDFQILDFVCVGCLEVFDHGETCSAACNSTILLGCK